MGFWATKSSGLCMIPAPLGRRFARRLACRCPGTNHLPVWISVKSKVERIMNGAQRRRKRPVESRLPDPRTSPGVHGMGIQARQTRHHRQWDALHHSLARKEKPVLKKPDTGKTGPLPNQVPEPEIGSIRPPRIAGRGKHEQVRPALLPVDEGTGVLVRIHCPRYGLAVNEPERVSVDFEPPQVLDFAVAVPREREQTDDVRRTWRGRLASEFGNFGAARVRLYNGTGPAGIRFQLTGLRPDQGEKHGAHSIHH